MVKACLNHVLRMCLELKNKLVTPYETWKVPSDKLTEYGQHFKTYFVLFHMKMLEQQEYELGIPYETCN